MVLCGALQQNFSFHVSFATVLVFQHMDVDAVEVGQQDDGQDDLEEESKHDAGSKEEEKSESNPVQEKAKSFYESLGPLSKIIWEWHFKAAGIQFQGIRLETGRVQAKGRQSGFSDLLRRQQA